MAVDDTLKRPAYVKRSLIELVGTAAPPAAWPAETAEPLADDGEASPPPKKSDPLPRPGDKYRAHARFQNRLATEQKLIHFIHGDFVCDGFSYHDLRHVRLVPSPQPGQGRLLMLNFFIGASITEVTLAANHIDDLHYYISEGTMPWVWEKPKGFRAANDQATVIHSINFAELER